MKKLSIFTMILAALVMASCDRTTVPGGETPVGDATISVKISGSASTKALTSDPATSEISITKLRIIIADADNKILANKYVTSVSNVQEVKEIVVPADSNYTILAIANESDTTVTAALDEVTSVGAVQNIISHNTLGSQYDNPTKVMLTGYVKGITLLPGQNYLGYKMEDQPTSISGGGTDNAFNVYRLVSLIDIQTVTNNTLGRLKIDSVYVLNAKNSVKLFPPKSGTSDLDADNKKYFDVMYSNIPAPGNTNDTLDDETFTQGALSNNVGGKKFPRHFGDLVSTPYTYDFTSPLVTTNFDDLGAIIASDYFPNSTPISVNKQFYVYPNYDYTSTTDDHATMLVITGIWQEDPTNTTGDGERVYYPIVVNKEAPGTSFDPSASSLAGGPDPNGTYVVRNRRYKINVNIASKGVNNPWTESIAYLDVMVTVGDWDATITQTVEF